jgi:hypothetical protein
MFECIATRPLGATCDPADQPEGHSGDRGEHNDHGEDHGMTCRIGIGTHQRLAHEPIQG